MVKTILYVEDDEYINRMMVRYLERAGHNIKSYQNGQEAYDCIANGLKYDLAILDLGLQGKTGEELVELSKKLNPDISVITMSGSYLKSEKADFSLLKSSIDFRNIDKIIAPFLEKETRV